MRKSTLCGIVEGIGILIVGIAIATGFLSGFTFHQDLLTDVCMIEFFIGSIVAIAAHEEKKFPDRYIFTGEKKKRRKSRKEIKADEQKKNRDAVYAFFVANELDSGNR